MLLLVICLATTLEAKKPKPTKKPDNNDSNDDGGETDDGSDDGTDDDTEDETDDDSDDNSGDSTVSWAFTSTTIKLLHCPNVFYLDFDQIL